MTREVSQVDRKAFSGHYGQLFHKVFKHLISLESLYILRIMINRDLIQMIHFAYSVKLRERNLAEI